MEVGSIRKSRLIVGVLLALALLLIVNLSATAQPGSFSLLSPENYENLNTNTPMFQWEPALGADNYRIVIDNDQGFSSPWYDNDNLENITSFTLPAENALPADGIYWWRVQAENEEGYTWSSENWCFRVDTLAPNAPSPTAPDNEENTDNTNPTFSWDAPTPEDNSLPITYHIWIDNNSDFYSPENENSGMTSTSYQPGFLQDDKWYWRVGVTDNAGNTGENSDTRWVRVDTVAPAPPSLTLPGNNENTNDNTPNLEWATVVENSKPVLYYVAVSDNSEFSYENENSGWIDGENYQIPSANSLPDGNWYWHVRAKDNAGNVGDNSDNWIFRVDKLMPRLLSPADGENTDNNRPTFSWENKVVADNYELQIDNESNFPAPLIYDNDNITDNQHELPVDNALSDGVYYWRVRGYKDENESIFSSVWSFRVDTLEPQAPSLVSPVAGENTNENAPTLDWYSVTDNSEPVLYYVAVSDNSEFPYENRGPGDWISATEWEVSPALPEGTWYWRVRAKDNVGNIGNHSQRSFQVDVTPPDFLGITESGVSKNSATIEWTTTEPATSQVEYGTTSGYGTTTDLISTLTTSHSVGLSGLDPSTTYHYRVISTDAANNTAWSDDQMFPTLALEAPTSSVNTISPYWENDVPFTITATADDPDGTVENVALYYSYSSDNSTWGDNLLFGVDNDNSDGWSWSFTADNGDGYYEFYTRATDNEDQVENIPSAADASAGVDTVSPTISSVQINGENTMTPSTSVVISIVAQDPDNLSGLDQMRFSNDNENWTGWEPYLSENDYVLPAGDENKTVYVQVKDEAGNESAVVDNWIVLETGVYVESLGTIAENENKLANFGQFGLLVTGINLFAKDNIDNVEVEVKVVQEMPAEISEAAPGTATYYFKAETNAPADNLAKVEIGFDVAKSWLDDLGIEEADVKLWKWDNTDNTWQKVLTTIIVGDNASHWHFSATVLSLSWFAVTGEKPAAPTPYLPVVAGVIIIVVILIVLIWWWKKQAPSSAPSQGVGVAGESQAHPEWTLNRKEP